MAHTYDVAGALRQYQMGVSIVPVTYQSFNGRVVDAALAADTRCSAPFYLADLRGWLSLCPAAGSIGFWQDEANFLPFEIDSTHQPHVTASAEPELDALLHRRQHVWARVPEEASPSGGVRQVATRHYISPSTSCNASHPFVFRVHYYCAFPPLEDAPPAALRNVLRARHSAKKVFRSSSGSSWNGDSSSVAAMSEEEAPSFQTSRSIAGAIQPFAQCQFTAFAELPPLCAHPPFDAPGPRRLGRLNGLYEGRSGYVATDNTERALTYGEVSAHEGSERRLRYRRVLLRLRNHTDADQPSSPLSALARASSRLKVCLSCSTPSPPLPPPPRHGKPTPPQAIRCCPWLCCEIPM